jgi:hypothetical protein
MLHRRAFITGLIAAPAIVRPGLLMPIRPIYRDDEWIDELRVTKGVVRYVDDFDFGSSDFTIEFWFRRLRAATSRRQND